MTEVGPGKSCGQTLAVTGRRFIVGWSRQVRIPIQTCGSEPARDGMAHSTSPPQTHRYRRNAARSKLAPTLALRRAQHLCPTPDLWERACSRWHRHIQDHRPRHAAIVGAPPGASSLPQLIEAAIPARDPNSGDILGRGVQSHGMKTRVVAILRQELAMGTPFDDTALVHYQDHVGFFDG